MNINISENKIAFLIPAYNEGRVIASTIKSLLKITDKENIFVVDDGSHDTTNEVAKSFLKNVITIKNGGKANAINYGIQFFELTKKYKYIMPVDADTVIHSNLQDVVLSIFNEDKAGKIAAVICKVRGRTTNILTTFRMWEYEISQIIHKSAQGVIDSIIVCPGCSTIYRSEVFTKIRFPSRTLTEDMDLTFIIHRKHLGKIVFTQDAEVTTQDPKRFKEYIKQMERWYTGFWMCVHLHKIPFGGQVIDFEVSMLALEGVFNGLLSLFFVIGIPLAILTNPNILIYPMLLDLVFFTIPTISYMAIKYKTRKIFLYIPIFYFLRIFNSLVFFKSFLKATVGLQNNKHFIWDTDRYDEIGKEEPWVIQASQ